MESDYGAFRLLGSEFQRHVLGFLLFQIKQVEKSYVQEYSYNKRINNIIRAYLYNELLAHIGETVECYYWNPTSFIILQPLIQGVEFSASLELVIIT